MEHAGNGNRLVFWILSLLASANVALVLATYEATTRHIDALQVSLAQVHAQLAAHNQRVVDIERRVSELEQHLERLRVELRRLR